MILSLLPPRHPRLLLNISGTGLELNKLSLGIFFKIIYTFEVCYLKRTPNTDDNIDTILIIPTGQYINSELSLFSSFPRNIISMYVCYYKE